MESLEDKIKRFQNNETYLKEKTDELQTAIKKTMELNRMISHLRIEKESLEEEARLNKKKFSDQIKMVNELQ